MSPDEYTPAPIEEGAATITVSMRVENTYELYEDVTVEFTDVVIQAPPAGAAEGSQEYEDWAYDHIYSVFTGVGHEDGDSWYDVEITACSDPALVGRKFDWGY